MPTGHLPIRTCVVCRQARAKKELIRLTLDSRNCVAPDLLQRGAGRGAYVCAEPKCLHQLRFGKRIQRAFRGKAKGLAQEQIQQLQKDRNLRHLAGR